MEGKKKLLIDVKTQDSKYNTIVYNWNTRVKFDLNDVAASVYAKYPALKERSDVQITINNLY